ncbi:MAG: response regulator transcription factor [Bacteroidales bacterium]
MEKNEIATIVLVDDHLLFRKGMVELISKFKGFSVIWEAGNGLEFIKKLKTSKTPEIVLLDIAMPEMDGFETASWIKTQHPEIKILVLSMFDQENSIIKMLKLGVNGFILKDADPSELREAMTDIKEKGFYYSELVAGTMASNIRNENKKADTTPLNEREIKFLELVCTEMTYKEIADKMFLSFRTIDGYRDNLFMKLEVKSRVGLALYAIKNGIFKI